MSNLYCYQKVMASLFGFVFHDFYHRHTRRLQKSCACFQNSDLLIVNVGLYIYSINFGMNFDYNLVVLNGSLTMNKKIV